MHGEVEDVHCGGLHHHGQHSKERAVLLDDEELAVAEPRLQVIVHRARAAAQDRDVMEG